MKTTSFKQLSEMEKKAILCGVIAKRTNGKITKEDIKTVVNKLDVSIQYTINIISDPKEFAKIIKLKDYTTDYGCNCGGMESIKEFETIILGNVDFGEDVFYSCPPSGNENNIISKDGDFDIKELHCILIKKHDFCGVSGASHEDKWSNDITFYIPEAETEYKLSPEIKALIEVFNIE
jgi:hypothetical protein